MSMWPSAHLVFGMAWESDEEPAGWEYDPDDYKDNFDDRMSAIVEELGIENVVEVSRHGHLDHSNANLIKARGLTQTTGAGEVTELGALPAVSPTVITAFGLLAARLGEDDNRRFGWLLLADYI